MAYQHRDLTGPGNRAIWATRVFAATQLLFSAVFIYQNIVIRQYLDGSAGDFDLDRTDQVVSIMGIVLIAVIIVVYTINGRFLYLAAANAQANFPDDKALSPGWAVGSYAVPIWNFWGPYRAMKETWERTFANKGDFPDWFIVWWTSWIGMNLFDRFLGRTNNPVTLEGFLSLNNWFILSGICWLVPSYYFIKIITALKSARADIAEVFD